MYRTFTRTWWIDNPTWPDGLEPSASDRDYEESEEFETEEAARSAAQAWNRLHNKGRYSLKMEYEEI